MKVSEYEAALGRLRQAKNECLAELHRENCVGDPHVTDENGRWLSNEEVYEKLKRGDKT